MTDLRQAIDLALDALEDIAKKTPTTHVRAGKAMIGDKEHVALWFDDSSDPIQQADYINQTKPEKMLAMIKALRQALAQPEQEPLGGEWVPCVKLPVIVHVRNQREGETHISTREGITPVLPDDLIMRGVAGEEYPIGRELFVRTYTFDTAPPKREWVGLTDEERHDIREWQEIQKELGPVWAPMMLYLYVAIEAKLKEKNGG